MVLSKYTIFSKIKNSENYFVLNLLSGQADILEPSLGMALEQGIIPDRDAFIQKGYLADPIEEGKLFTKKHLEFIDNRESDEIQIFFVPCYSCNFACTYCFQSEYETSKSRLTDEVIDSFFKAIKRQFEGRKFYVTLFGGEPLLPSSYARSMIEYFLKKAKENNVPIAIVTNGFTLETYLPILSSESIREIQVTLDGTQVIHDNRRPLKGSSESTFNAIVRGIDAALEKQIAVNFRVVVDKDNIDNLSELAQFAIERGWTKDPNFKTQLGRNYELHHCSAKPDNLFSRIALYEKIYALIKQSPHILEFHKPAFSISKFLWENGSLPDPLFDACPGCKTEWALDYTGSIYSCTATVGKSDEVIGSFYPEITLDDEKVAEWRERDITTIEACRTCNVNLACGGGCAAVAKKDGESLLSPDCRPIKGLLELGLSHYFES